MVLVYINTAYTVAVSVAAHLVCGGFYVCWSCLNLPSAVEVRWSASEYSVLEDAGDLSVSLSATSLADLNCGGPVVVTIGLAPIPFSAMPFDISNGELGLRTRGGGLVLDVYSFNVLLPGGSDGDFVLDVETFSNSPVEVTFLPGEEVSTAHTIDLVGDNVYEGEESFYLDIMNISAPASCASKIKISSQSRVQVLLVDNDGQPPPPFSVYPMYLSINPSDRPTATLNMIE